jgi:hypothetical protein
MTSKKEENESTKQRRERLAEIGRILCTGIKRLIDLEASKNNLNRLDYTTKASVHEANTNLNRGGL